MKRRIGDSDGDGDDDGETRKNATVGRTWTLGIVCFVV